MTLQELVDGKGRAVRLSPDEYEGPLVIRHPCTIDGGGSTVWCAQGPVVTVRADNVVLENLRIELTGQSGDQCALRCERPGTVLRNVEVYGLACGCGFPAEPLSVPRTVDLGVFAAEKRNVFVQPLTLPAPARVRAGIVGMQVEPRELPAGASELRITTGELRSGTSVYGEIFLDGAVMRRMYLRGRAEKGAPVHEAGPSGRQAAIPQAAARRAESDAVTLHKGERRDLAAGGDVEIRLEGAADPGNIDCYVFCLGANGKVRGDSGLIFFGQERSPDGSVRILRGTPGAIISPARAETAIDRIVVAFSAYSGTLPAGGRPEVSVAAGGSVMLYPLTEYGGIRTVTALHLYRRGNGWRLWCTDHRSREGIEALCAEYGVEVE